MSDSPHSRDILVVGPSWVGDMVMAQSLFMRLKQRSPDSAIDVIAPPWSLPLLDRMPEVRAGISLPIGHGELKLGQRRRIGKSLGDKGYGQVIVLPNSLKSALLPFWTGIPRRTGFRGEWRYGLLNDVRILDKQALPMTVLRFLHLADDIGAAPPTGIPTPRLQISSEEVGKARAEFGLNDAHKPVLALCPGAEYGPAKRWPESHFADIARQRLSEGWQVWLFGSEKDRPVTAAIVELAPGCQDLAGRTSLANAIDLLSEADAVISNDSGLMHVAAALDRPLVALYGSSDPGFTPPLHDRHKVLRLGLDCSPCFKRDCPLGHTDCLNKITPASVREALSALA